MTAEAKEKSDYRVQDWWPKFKLYDWIPLGGIVTFAERTRRNRGLSWREGYFPWTNLFIKDKRADCIETLKSLGTANWPEPTDRAAYFRSVLMAIRNGAFPGYHVLVPMYAYVFGPDLIKFTESILQR